MVRPSRRVEMARLAVNNVELNIPQACEVFGISQSCIDTKPKKRIIRKKPEKLSQPDKINEVRSMDFVHDQLQDVRSIRLFNVNDDFNREGFAIEGNFFPSERENTMSEASD